MIKIGLFTLLVILVHPMRGQDVKKIIEGIREHFGLIISDNLSEKDPLKITNLDIVDSEVSDLKSLSVFQNLRYLRLMNCNISSFLGLPKFIYSLNLEEGTIDENVVIPNSVRELIYIDSNSNILPVIPNTLKSLSIRNNNFHRTKTLPDSLENLDCSENELTKLPRLPKKLRQLGCSKNLLLKLPKLPKNLNFLACDNNKLKKLPNLPNRLIGLDCSFNNINKINKLPIYLRELNCKNNTIYKLGKFQKNLWKVNLVNNPIKKMQSIKKCDIQVLPSHLNPATDFRSIMLASEYECPPNFKDITFSIYKSFVDYDFKLFLGKTITLEVIDVAKTLAPMHLAHQFEKKSFISENDKLRFIGIAEYLDSELLILDSVSIYNEKKLSEFLTITQLYLNFKSIGNGWGHGYVLIDVLNSPQGKFLLSFSSSLDYQFTKKYTPIDSLPNEMPNDFEFIFVNGDDVFNSNQNIYSKGLACYHRAFAKIELSKIDKKIIYDELKLINFHALPNNLVEINDSHFPTTSISITFGTIRKEVTFNTFSCLELCKNEQIIALQKLALKIDTILHNYNEILNMPKQAFIRI